MSKKVFPYFYSKILLFGEYSLMVGSKALSMPSDQYRGRLSFSKAQTLQGLQIQSNHDLRNYAHALKVLTETGKLQVKVNFNELFDDLDRGLYFESTIPQGYGLGSSGALVAAVYDAYVLEPQKKGVQFSNSEIAKLKNVFSIMESFFHGKSSGLDPLICFSQKAVFVESSELVSFVEMPVSNTKSSDVIFLLDTGSSGETQPLVNYFIKQCKNRDYLREITSELIPLNNQCIVALLNSDAVTLQKGMRALSEFTLDYFSPMVPDKIKDIWIAGLSSRHYSLKLCGSGGGGMMLGFTRDFDRTQSAIRDFKLTPVFRF